MSLRYGFFDSEISGYDEEGMPIFDRAESSDFLAMFIAKIISDGVLAAPSDCFQVIAGQGMTIRVKPGFGIVKGRFAFDDTETEIVLENAPKSYKRFDRIILRANYLERRCEIIKRTGTPDSTPVPPALIRPASGDYYELCLANILVNSNQTEITQANITDTRPDSSVCGFVTQVIDHIDTSVFYAQFDQFYKEFVSRSNTTYANWTQSMIDYLNTLQNRGDTELQSIVDLFVAFEQNGEADFLAWFQSIKDQLSTDAAGNLQNQIDGLTERVGIMEDYFVNGSIYVPLAAEDGNTLATESGDVIEAYWRLCACRA